MTVVQRLNILVIALIALTVFGCSSAPKVYSNVDSSADFSNYKTFGFFPELATDRGKYESLESSSLKVSVTDEMERRGFEYAENPDLLVNFYIHTKEKVRSRTTPTMGGGYYGYRDPYYDQWGGYETRVDQYTEGTLNIDMVDAEQKALVWEGSVSGRITEEVQRNLGREISKAVVDIFTAFPVPPLDAGESNGR